MKIRFSPRWFSFASFALLGACEEAADATSVVLGTADAGSSRGVAAVAEGGAPCSPGHAGGETSLYVDDFEDSDGLPRSPAFALWQGFAYNPPDQPVTVALSEPGMNSNASLRLEWHVRDELDGALSYPGAGVRTLAATDYLDLTVYTHLLVAHRHAPQVSDELESATRDAGSLECRNITHFVVYMPCRQYSTQVEMAVPVSDAWQTASLPLADFAIPSWLPSDVSVQQCLAAADGLVFRAQADLADGECSRGSLWLDSIALR